MYRKKLDIIKTSRREMEQLRSGNAVKCSLQSLWARVPNVQHHVIAFLDIDWL